MIHDYRSLVREVIEATTFQSPVSYAWFGQLTAELPTEAAHAMTAATQRAYLVFTLQSQLYRDFYCAGSATPSQPPPGSAATTYGGTFTQILSAANHGRGSRESGWQYCGRENGNLIVERDGLRLWVRPEETLGVNPSTVTTGESVTLRFPKELLKLSPGFYMALGDAGLSEEPRNLLRFYWNLRSEGAATLIGEATSRLNRASVPFRLKVAATPELYTRCDAGVLYVTRSTFRTVARILTRIYPRVSGDLKAAIPSFAKPLAFGLGFAEEPGNGDSFGMHRCALLADGLVRAAERGSTSIDERLSIVAERFAEDGVSLDTPYLNFGSSDIYDLDWRTN